MIPSDVYGRVLCLAVGDVSATGFLVDVDGRQYLVTARHFALEITSDGPLRVLFNGAWQDLGGRLVGHAPGEIDISVLVLDGIAANPVLSLIPDQTIFYGQDVYFLGYPHGLWGDMRSSKLEHALPFVRKAIVSCVESFADGAHRNFLAGHNVPGFSGGPVVWSATPMAIPPRDFRVTSVVSGYKFVDAPIFADGSKTNAIYQENTGVIITYGIRHALDLIRANPIGVPVPAAVTD